MKPILKIDVNSILKAFNLLKTLRLAGLSQKQIFKRQNTRAWREKKIIFQVFLSQRIAKYFCSISRESEKMTTDFRKNTGMVE